MNHPVKPKSFTTLIISSFVLIGLLMGPGWLQAEASAEKTKVLYHVDGADPKVAKYAMALINKHIEAEGGPENIDVVLVVHGPALPLFAKKTIDPGLAKKFQLIIDNGAQAEMCQVSMKIFNKPLDELAPGFKPTAHPVAVKRIADLQKEGYIYIKP